MYTSPDNYKIRERKGKTLTKNWKDHQRKGTHKTHGDLIKIFWWSQMSFSIRREWMYVNTRQIWCHFGTFLSMWFIFILFLFNTLFYSIKFVNVSQQFVMLILTDVHFTQCWASSLLTKFNVVYGIQVLECRGKKFAMGFYSVIMS